MSRNHHILSVFSDKTTNMKTIKNKNITKLALFAGATALAALAPQAQAQSSDALIDKLVDKGVLTVDEAKDLRNEADKDFKTAFQAKTGMPDWVTSYTISGDFRGRFDQMSATDNSHYVNRQRERFRLRFGIVANIVDNMEVGLRLTSGDNASGGGTGSGQQGNPLSSNSTMQNNGTKKGIWIDTAYGKWTAINSGDWLLAATIGKMDNPFNFTPMVFDPDYTPEGGVITGSYTINDKQSVSFTGAAFVLDEESGATADPAMYGGQVLLNSKWTPKLASSVGGGLLMFGSPKQLSASQVPYQNQGNTYNSSGALVYNYNPIIADANATYTLDSFPMYPGAFPIKVGGEFIHNPAAAQNNTGFWLGATLGKSGTKHTWDISYRYEWLEADAMYCQMVDDDSVAYYQNPPVGASVAGGTNPGIGAYAGTNIKGHMVKMNYSITDSLTFSLTGYVTSLINSSLQVPTVPNVNEPNNTMVHFMADIMWKF